jgi:hypothetical protein
VVSIPVEQRYEEIPEISFHSSGAGFLQNLVHRNESPLIKSLFLGAVTCARENESYTCKDHRLRPQILSSLSTGIIPDGHKHFPLAKDQRMKETRENATVCIPVVPFLMVATVNLFSSPGVSRT